MSTQANTSRASTEGDKLIRILVVDDHPLMRDGLSARIGQERDMKICGEADDVDPALALLGKAKPDVVIVDLSLKHSHGLDLIKQIHGRSSAKILVLSAYSEGLYGERVLRLGALGFIHKQQAQKHLVEAIRTVAAGKRYISNDLEQRLLELVIDGRGKSSGMTALSDRELQVFELIGSGKSTRAIAQQLGLSIHTIESHRENIRSKLDLKNGSQLVQQAVQWVLESRTT